jgi:hypothetical protein
MREAGVKAPLAAKQNRNQITLNNMLSNMAQTTLMSRILLFLNNNSSNRIT